MDTNLLVTMMLLDKLSPNSGSTNTNKGQGTSTFSKALSSLMLGSNLSSSLTSNPLASDSESTQSIFPQSSNSMAPILLMLLDKVMSMETTQQKSNKSTSNYGTSPKTTNTASLLANQTYSASKDPVVHLSSSDQSIPSGKPVDGSLTQGYSASRHYGLDFGIGQGSPVKSTQGGKVTYAGWNSQGYGNLVIVDNGTYSTYYGHLSKFNVSVGQDVNPGIVLGLSGNTGNSTGPHLHYEIRKNGIPIDPTAQTLNS